MKSISCCQLRMETAYFLKELSWNDFLSPQPMSFFNPSLAGEQSAYHTSISALLWGCPCFLVKFSFKIAFEDCPLLELYWEHCVHPKLLLWLFKINISFSFTVPKCLLKINQISVFWWGIGLCDVWYGICLYDRCPLSTHSKFPCALI